MIPLFHIPSHKVDTASLGNLLHGSIVTEFEKAFAKFVGAKYAVSFNSATSAIFLALLDKNVNVGIPTILPPVVANAIITSGNSFHFIDNPGWVGHSYVLHDFGNYKLIDSAQKVRPKQFKEEAQSEDLMIFSFYPTKPIGSCDGGMIVSDDKGQIEYLRMLSMNGMTPAANNWDRKIVLAGYKMYMNSIQASMATRNLSAWNVRRSILEKNREYYNKEFVLDNTSEHLYQIEVTDRKKFIKKMHEAGIVCGIHYEPLHENWVYAKHSQHMDWKDQESLTGMKHMVSIPYHVALTKKDLSYIVKKVNQFA